MCWAKRLPILLKEHTVESAFRAFVNPIGGYVVKDSQDTPSFYIDRLLGCVNDDQNILHSCARLALGQDPVRSRRRVLAVANMYQSVARPTQTEQDHQKQHSLAATYSVRKNEQESLSRYLHQEEKINATSEEVSDVLLVVANPVTTESQAFVKIKRDFRSQNISCY
eukprot:9481877-Pyramimonas_sp.AAC.1